MKKIQKALSGLLAGLMLFTSVPVSALPSIVSDSTTEVVEPVEEENSPEIITEDISTDETADDAESESTESSGNQESTTQNEVSEPTQSSENETTEIPSNELKNSLISTIEGDVSAPLTGWNISMKVYDNDVDNGNTAVTNIDWNLNPPVDENGANYDYEYSKTIKMLITYSNDKSIKTYNPGEITILVPALKPVGSDISTDLYCTMETVANDDTHIGFPWTFTGYNADFTSSTTSQSKYAKYYTFTNAETLEANTNFEGSIQLTYTLRSLAESQPESDYNEHLREYANNLNVKLMLTEDFNKIKDNYHEYKKIVSEQIDAELKKELDYDNSLASFDTELENYLTENNINLITTPGYPDYFPTLTEEIKYFTFDNADSITLYFDDESYTTQAYARLEVFDQNTNTLLETIGGELYNAKKTFNTNSIKTRFTYDNVNTQRFLAIVSDNNNLSSNEINKYIDGVKNIIEAKKAFINDYKEELNIRCENISVNNIVDVSNIETLQTEQMYFNYSRHYLHPWVKTPYEIKQEAIPVSVPDILPSGWEDYIWVNYKFTDTLNYQTLNECTAYPKLLVPCEWGVIKVKFPDGVKVISGRGNIISPTNGVYELTYQDTHKASANRHEREIYVGYPKSVYNEENNNLIITNKIELWGPYARKSNDSEYLNEDEISLNLADFEFKYSGELIAIEKRADTTNSNNLYYQNIALQKGERTRFAYDIAPDFNYYGAPTTLKIGDDILFSSDLEGDYSKVSDDDYYFSSISFPWLVNKAGNQIASKYSCELWIRRANETEYSLYAGFRNAARTFDFTEEDKVVGFYFVIKDLREGILGGYKSNINVDIVFTRKDIPTTGRLYNFSYVQLYTKDDNGQLIWQNKASLENYDTAMTQMKIAEYDKETYGDYVQRSTAYLSWTYYNLPKPTAYLQISKGVTDDKQIIQDETNQQFLGTYALSVNAKGNAKYLEDYIEDYDKNYLISGYKIYDLLPKGVNLISTEKEILESITTSGSGSICFVDENGNKFYKNDICDMIKKNASIKIVENWKNTGRTLITINMPFDKPLFCFYYSSNPLNIWTIILNFDFSIPYDSYLEYGATFKNIVYGEWVSDTYSFTQGNLDNGKYDSEAIDINGNGSTSDYLVSSTVTTELSPDIATHQDVQTSGASTIDDFNTGIISAEYDKTYTYKLRVRTGQNNISNLIIYDNLERWTKNKDGNYIESSKGRDYWQGTLQSVDTSYAESKGYTVKVWYSENEKAEALTEDTSWKEYSDSIDNTKVKSLAFQYLDSNGKPAIIPAGNMTYVLVNMKAPTDEKIKTLAYNGCWTQWNAIDEFGQIIPDITGINSNIVKVALPNTVLADSIPSIELDITKEIIGTNEAFENLGLDHNVSSSRPDFLRVQACYFNATIIMITQSDGKSIRIIYAVPLFNSAEYNMI